MNPKALISLGSGIVFLDPYISYIWTPMEDMKVIKAEKSKSIYITWIWYLAFGPPASEIHRRVFSEWQ